MFIPLINKVYTIVLKNIFYDYQTNSIKQKKDLKAYKKGRVTIVETMGRDAGWLAASSSLASRYDLGPDLIYVPECAFKKEEFLEDIKRIYQEKGKVFIVVSEALKDENGEYRAKEPEASVIREIYDLVI